MLSIAQLSLVMLLVPLVAGIALAVAGGRPQRRTAIGIASAAAIIAFVASAFVASAIVPTAPLLYTLVSSGKGGIVERLDSFAVYLLLGITAWVTPVLLWMTAPRGRAAAEYPTSARPMGLALLIESVALGAVLLDNVPLIALCWAGVGFFAWLMARPQEALRPSTTQEWIDLLLLTLGPILFLLVMIFPMAGGKTISLYGLQGHLLFTFWSGALMLVVLAFAAGLYPFIIWVRRVAQGVLPEAAGALVLVSTPIAVALLGRLLSVLTPTGSWPTVHIGPATVTLNIIAIILGLLTVVVAGIVLLFEQDLLVITALLSTLTLGWGFIAIGSGDNHALIGLTLLLLAQTLGVGTLLLIWSSLEWAERDLRVNDLAGLARALPLHAVALALAGLTLVGAPLFIGFAGMLTIDQSLLSLGGTAALAGALIWIGNALALIGVVRLLSRALHQTPLDLAERALPERWESLALIIPAALLLLFGIAPEILFIGPSPVNPGIAVTAATLLFGNTGLLQDVSNTAYGFRVGSALWIPGILWAMAAVAAIIVALSGGLTNSSATLAPAFAGGEALPDEDHEPTGQWLDLAPLALSPWLLPGPRTWRYDLADVQEWTAEDEAAEEDATDETDEADEDVVVEEEEVVFVDASDDEDETNALDADDEAEDSPTAAAGNVIDSDAVVIDDDADADVSDEDLATVDEDEVTEIEELPPPPARRPATPPRPRPPGNQPRQTGKGGSNRGKR